MFHLTGIRIEIRVLWGQLDFGAFSLRDYDLSLLNLHFFVQIDYWLVWGHRHSWHSTLLKMCWILLHFRGWTCVACLTQLLCNVRLKVVLFKRRVTLTNVIILQLEQEVARYEDVRWLYDGLLAENLIFLWVLRVVALDRDSGVEELQIVVSHLRLGFFFIYPYLHHWNSMQLGFNCTLSCHDWQLDWRLGRQFWGTLSG